MKFFFEYVLEATLAPKKEATRLKNQILNRFHLSTHSRTPCFLVKQSFKIQAVKDYDYIPPSLQFSSPFLKPLLYILQCIRCEKQKQTGGVQIIHKPCLKSKLIYLSTLAEGHRDTNHDFFLFGLLLRRNAATYLFITDLVIGFLQPNLAV